jgi:hypothetical protein
MKESETTKNVNQVSRSPGRDLNPETPKYETVIQSAIRNVNDQDIGLNGTFLRFRRDGVSVSYTVICLSHFDVCLAIT